MVTCWVFDVDGTLSDPTHRRHHVQNNPRRWDLWNMKMVDDTPHHDILQFVCVAESLGHAVVVCTGREEDYRDVTTDWLAKHDVYPAKVYMRKTKDYRGDDVVKKELLDQMRNDGFEPLLVFDDRQKVVDMWRANGLRCLQVSEGNF